MQQPPNSPNTSPEPTSAQPEPGAEAPAVLTQDTEAISELFSRSLDTWTDQDMDRMVTELRKRRVEFLVEDKAAKKKKAEPKAPKVSTAGKSADEIMAQLGLDL